MKLLFDQNLSFRLARKLEEYFPESEHVRLSGMDKDDDRLIWQYARDNDFIIVTQDADFEMLSQLYGFPPKVIWLRCGNTATLNIYNLLLRNHEIIYAFGEDDLVACIELQ